MFFYRWEKIGSCDNFLACFFFKCFFCIVCYFSSLFRRNFIFFESLGLHTLSDTPCRELSKSGEEEFFFAHMISEIMSFCESLDIFVCFYIDTRPFFVNYIREDSKFIAFVDTVIGPVVG